MRKAVLVVAGAFALGMGTAVFVHAGTAGNEGAPSSVRAAGTKSPSTKSQPAAARTSRRPSPVRTRSTVAILGVPRLHLRSRIFAASELDRGPAWWPVTGRPGGGDTVAIAGHRTTHTRPFYFLERLRRGDRIYARYLGRTFAYTVTRSTVVPATNLHIGDAVGHERLLLTACTPRGSASHRLVVEARPVAPDEGRPREER